MFQKTECDKYATGGVTITSVYFIQFIMNQNCLKKDD